MVGFDKIHLARYTFTIIPLEELILPPYKGSTLRGGFGSVFRRISCVDKNNSSCKDCLLKEKCAYSYIFETSPPPDSSVLKNLDDIPRPFIIEPPLETKRIYRSDEKLDFNLILIGRAIDYLPYFIVTFKELGSAGIGKLRKNFELNSIRIHSIHGKTQDIVYSSKDETVRNVDSRFTWREIIENSKLKAHNSKFLTLRFFTPARLKHKDEYVNPPEFHVFIRTLLRRISNLAYFHCSQKLEIDYKNLISRAKKVKIEKTDTQWIDWERYSFAQKQRMKLGGFIGEVTYKGDFEAFLPFLLLGQYTHLGKGATFGMGWYEMEIP
jgi:CRISPR-associated endoribonuclease Cas6